MKIGKQLIGRIVRLVWIGDPVKERVSKGARRYGRGSLAQWIEYGRIDAVVDGVVNLIHSEGFTLGSEPDEFEETRLPEDLIQDVQVLQTPPQADAPPSGPDRA